ncbi:hypothetical protein N7530_007833 [Penicillium desertorum]|uniref:Uncharacterized protein n=1 Tax=Penicillium desertorum TaxID=1303715 RepID=A0A9W9WN19_9EURO|nr:hypothetical protein N7530_007833 [Penicillium desertorum]
MAQYNTKYYTFDVIPVELAHIPPFPSTTASPHAGDTNARSMMMHVKSLYDINRNFFPSSTTRVICAWCGEGWDYLVKWTLRQLHFTLWALPQLSNTILCPDRLRAHFAYLWHTLAILLCLSSFPMDIGLLKSMSFHELPIPRQTPTATIQHLRSLCTNDNLRGF